jgi:hypothetical protein
MTFLVYERALDDWRRQATLVGDLWESYLAADREGRVPAFRAYMAALDREEAAANELVGLRLAKVA